MRPAKRSETGANGSTKNRKCLIAMGKRTQKRSIIQTNCIYYSFLLCIINETLFFHLIFRAMRLVSDINNGNFEQLGVTSQVSI